MRTGQSFSLDVVLAVVIFGFITVVFASVALIDRPDVEDLQATAEEVVSELDTIQGCGEVLGDNQVNDSGIQCLYNQTYNTLKRQLRVEGNFCIYMEDEQGRLLPVNSSNGTIRTSWGNRDLLVGGVPCGS